MALITHAFIEHRLTPEEIIKLPGLLREVHDETIKGLWYWTNPQMDRLVLSNYWTLSSDHFLKNEWNDKDLALLRKDEFTIHFFNPHLLTFNSLIQWNVYNTSNQVKREFDQLTKTITRIVKAVDVLFTPDLSSVDFFDENKDLSVDSYRKKAKITSSMQ